MKLTDIEKWFTESDIGPTGWKFIQDNIALALRIVTRLAWIHNGQSFHQWKEEAIALVKAQVGELSGTYTPLLIHIAYEQYQAGRAFFLVRWVRQFWGFVTRAGLDDFLKSVGAKAVAEAVRMFQILLAAQDNAQVGSVRDQVWTALRAEYANAHDNWLGWVVSAAWAILVKRGIIRV